MGDLINNGPNNSTDGNVMIGIDLLMNNAMKRSSSSGSINIGPVGAGSAGSYNSTPPASPVASESDRRIRHVVLERPTPPPEPPSMMRPTFNNDMEPGGYESEGEDDEIEEEPPVFKYASTEPSESSGEEQQQPFQRRSYTNEEILNKKRDILYQFDRLANKGVHLPRRYTMSDNLEDMQMELERLKLDREVDISVRFQRKMLMACVTGVEMLNGKFDPFDIKLDGWSDTVHENINDYDDVFEELHMKYRGKAKMAPELKLMFMVGGSGLMFHLTSTMFKSASVPGLEQVLKQNPALMQQFANATMATMQQQQAPSPPQPSQPQANNSAMGANPFGMLSSLFGMGSPSAPAPPPPPPPTDQGARMRGPKNVDDILKDLHRDAFNKVEIVSNASDSDVSELREETPKKRAASKRAGPAGAGGRGGGRGRGGRKAD